MAETPEVRKLNQLVSETRSLQNKIASIIVYDTTEAQLQKAVRLLDKVSTELQAARKIVEDRGK